MIIHFCRNLSHFKQTTKVITQNEVNLLKHTTFVLIHSYNLTGLHVITVKLGLLRNNLEHGTKKIDCTHVSDSF